MPNWTCCYIITKVVSRGKRTCMPLLSQILFQFGHKMLESQPLPANPFVACSPESNAYARCLTWEVHAPDTEVQEDKIPPLLGARLLGYMLLYAPTHSGCLNTANQINDCTDELELLQLAEHYAIHLIGHRKSFLGVCCFDVDPTYR